MEKRFAIGYDGFVQRERSYTLEEVKVVWQKNVKNTWLYEYDCSVYELNEDGSLKRTVSYEEVVA